MARRSWITTAPAALAALAAALAAALPAQAGGDADTAALQVGLRAQGVYAGAVDGVFGPETSAAVAALQRRAGLPATGAVGPATKAALGAYARASLGGRPLAAGAAGWDVAALQFLLAGHGFPSGPFDGVFSARTEGALRRFQDSAGLAADGVAGPAVLAALRRPPPAAALRLAWPVAGGVPGDPFGPRGDRFHAGLDLLAPLGAPVVAAAGGRVVYAGWRDGGFGNEVTVADGTGTRILYAHLSRVDVTLGATVATGEPLGLVGATGDAVGPHLHLEVRVRGAAVDPEPALPPAGA